MKVSKEELKAAGINEPKRCETEGEKFVNEKVSAEKISDPVASDNRGTPLTAEELTDAEVSPASNNPSPAYATRKRGILREELPWVMDRPVEFKVRK